MKLSQFIIVKTLTLFLLGAMMPGIAAGVIDQPDPIEHCTELPIGTCAVEYDGLLVVPYRLPLSRFADVTDLDLRSLGESELRSIVKQSLERDALNLSTGPAGICDELAKCAKRVDDLCWTYHGSLGKSARLNMKDGTCEGTCTKDEAEIIVFCIPVKPPNENPVAGVGDEPEPIKDEGVHDVPDPYRCGGSMCKDK